MERYFTQPLKLTPPKIDDSSSKKRKVDFDLYDLPLDPGLRPPISDYHPNIRDEVRRAYLQRGPRQPKEHNFEYSKFGKQLRRFNPTWFSRHGNWLEYSISKNAAFCLCCYLFRPDTGKQGGGDAFTLNGFKNWKKAEKLIEHVGEHNSAHIEAVRKCDALMKQEQHVRTFFDRHPDLVRKEYRTSLTASIDCLRFLLEQGLVFRGHDESENSSNPGNFLGLLEFLGDHNEDIKTVTLGNAPEHIRLTSHDIQKDIICACSIETTNAIIKEMGDALFSVLIDESRDMSSNEQMVVVFRYVNKSGQVIERLIAVKHVTITTSVSLKKALDDILSGHGLCFSRLRGQSYNGASNMQGELNGLKKLILKENKCAYFVHCFAHELQLAIVAVAKKHDEINYFFNVVANVVNIIGGSPKNCDILREKQFVLVEALNNGEISSGQCQNQESNMKRFGDICWGSHYGTLLNIISLFPSIIDLLDIVAKDVSNSSEQRFQSNFLLELMSSFDFVFSLYLMKEILGLTNELSLALQRKDQDIVNAMKLVEVCKQNLQLMRESGWDSLLDHVADFCGKNDIDAPNIDDMFLPWGRSQRKASKVTNMHHYRVELFNTVLDMQLQELNNRFNEVNTQLLLCLACLSPNDSFASFDKEKLVHLAKFYPKEFSPVEVLALEVQLQTYIVDMRSSPEFSGLKGINDLAVRMVDTKKDKVYPLVYMLLTLALILPVASATVERAFSTMNTLKTRLRNQIGDQWLNDSLVVYIEKNIFRSIDNEAIVQRFQNMKSCREQL